MPATPQWAFYRKQPTDPIHNPIAGEFFSTEAVHGAAEALVREGIQNSLDAHPKDAPASPKRVRIYLSGTQGALAPAQAKRWFQSLKDHMTAPGNGLRELHGPMKAEAASAGVYDSPGGTQHARLQILSIPDLLDGRSIGMPPAATCARSRRRQGSAGWRRGRRVCSGLQK